MKMLHLKNIETAVSKLFNVDLPIKLAYKLNLIIGEVEKHLTTLQQFRINFLNKHGERQADGSLRIETAKIKEFDEGLDELLQEEIDLKPVEIPLSLLFDTEIKFTVLEIEALKNAGFIVDDINNNEQ